MIRTKSLALALMLALTGWTGVASSAAVIGAKPDSLLSVDSNRSAIIDRVVASWGAALEQSGSGVDRTQLRSMLEHLRADQLLAASMSGSLDGVRDVLTKALVQRDSVSTGFMTKALGNNSMDTNGNGGSLSVTYTSGTSFTIGDTANNEVLSFNCIGN